MIYKNKHNLPGYLKDWLESDNYDYDENTVSATSLLSPARQFALFRLYGDELEVDVADMVASRYGTSIHDSFEKVPMENTDKEKRVYHTFNIDGEEYKLSGKFDMIIDTDKEVQKLVDIKSTSVWTFIYGSKDEDYVKQLSIYRYLANKNGYNVGDDAEICMVFTDWSKSRAKKERNYPNLRVAIKPIKLMSVEDTELFIIQRLKAFQTALKNKDNLPLCTDEELWKEEDKWMVKQYWQKKNIRICNSEQEAKEFIQDNNLKRCAINFKKGKVKRCRYCAASKVCSQYKELKQKGLIE
jgi:hypothetical protein